LCHSGTPAPGALLSLFPALPGDARAMAAGCHRPARPNHLDSVRGREQ
jgi:hypothetical protein